jgi:hypothetical protein
MSVTQADSELPEQAHLKNQPAETAFGGHFFIGPKSPAALWASAAV